MSTVLQRSTYDEHFKTTELEYKVQFKGISPEKEEETEAAVVSALEMLMKDVRRRVTNPSDQISVMFSNEHFPGKDLTVPYTSLDDIGAKILADMVARIIQSNANFQINTPFTITIQIQEMDETVEAGRKK